MCMFFWQKYVRSFYFLHEVPTGIPFGISETCWRQAPAIKWWQAPKCDTCFFQKTLILHSQTFRKIQSIFKRYVPQLLGVSRWKRWKKSKTRHLSVLERVRTVHWHSFFQQSIELQDLPANLEAGGQTASATCGSYFYSIWGLCQKNINHQCK